MSIKRHVESEVCSSVVLPKPYPVINHIISVKGAAVTLSPALRIRICQSPNHNPTKVTASALVIQISNSDYGRRDFRV
jgi:hypothetical protein